MKNARFFTVFAWSGPKTGGEGASNSSSTQLLEFGGVGEGGKEKNRGRKEKEEEGREKGGGQGHLTVTVRWAGVPGRATWEGPR